jgi:hypothetical protein
MHLGSSSEAFYAWKMAITYGPEVCRLDRAGRIAWAQEEIARLKREHDDECEAHKRECERCQRHEFCMEGFSFTKEQRERWDMIHRLEGMIDSEQYDHKYAERAYARGVVYKDHVNTFNHYSCNVSDGSVLPAGNARAKDVVSALSCRGTIALMATPTRISGTRRLMICRRYAASVTRKLTDDGYDQTNERMTDERHHPRPSPRLVCCLGASRVICEDRHVRRRRT